MALIRWDEKYSVNIVAIDTEHKRLVELINKLHDSMRDRKTDQVLGTIVSELVQYTKTHFATEENFLSKNGYPKLNDHKKEHKDFIQKISDFEDGFKNGKLMLSMEIISFLKDWLIKHIQGSDKEYGDYFSS